MKDAVFTSSLASWFEGFVKFKRLQGFDYTRCSWKLRHLDLFIEHQGQPIAHLTEALFEKFEQDIKKQTLLNQHRELSLLHDFSRYLNQKLPESPIYDLKPFKRPPPRKGFYYSDEDLRNLMKATRRLKRASIRPHTYSTLIGLLATTGIRVGEALALQVKDFDPRFPSLFIRKGKLGKERWIPISVTTGEALTSYLLKQVYFSSKPGHGHVFLNARDTPLKIMLADVAYRQLIDSCGIEGRSDRLPCLRDWRHTFAVNCLLKWERAGLDVNARLPILATYLGHVGVSCTQLYLQSTAEMKAKAGERFKQHFFNKGDCQGGLR